MMFHVAAKPGRHAALRVLPGGVWRPGVLSQLRAAVTGGQQGIGRGYGAHGTS
jgi:hypothetical protein